VNTLRKWIFENIMKIASLILATYFFYVFHSIVGFPPAQELNSSSITYLVISIFFFLLPFAKKLKIGKSENY